MKNVDLVIIGGGPAGLAAAVAARKSGVQDILILERDSELGGQVRLLSHYKPWLSKTVFTGTDVHACFLMA